MKEIKLTKGYVALVDDEDFERCSQFKWRAFVTYRTDGTIRTVYADGKNGFLHRFILSVSDVKVKVDHIDGNGLNCQKSNLRIATSAQNVRNMQTVRSNSSSGYKGVSWHVAKKWRAQVRIGGTNKNLGYFHTAEEAAKVYDAAALLYFGEFACTNFPREDYLCMLPVTGDWKVDADAGDGWRGQWSDRALKQIDGVLSVIAAELGINVDELHTSTGAGRKPGARGYIVYALHQLSQGNVEGAKNTLENALSGAA